MKSDVQKFIVGMLIGGVLAGILATLIGGCVRV